LGFPRKYTHPVGVVVELSSVPDTAQCCELFEGLPYRLLLDSAARGTRLGRYSFLMADPYAVVRSKGARAEVVDVASGTARQVDSDVMTDVRALLAPHHVGAVAGLPPFQGGAAGFLAYDWGRTLERIPECRYDDLPCPTRCWGSTTGRSRGTTTNRARG